MLAPNVVEELRARLMATPGEKIEIELMNGRKAYCFRGETAEADARRSLEKISAVPLSGIEQIVPGTYCFVV